MSEGTETARAEPRGIGGWLVLPLLGLAISPLQGLWTQWQAWPILTQLGQLPTLGGGFVVVEMLVNALLQIAAAIYLLTQMLQKRSGFPRYYQMWLVAGLVWVVLDLLIGYALFKGTFDSGAAELFDRETMRSLVSAVISVAIWVPYMARSVRVRNTFLN